MAQRAVIFGCEGLRLAGGERAFFAQSDPWGFILFARNIDTPEQVLALTSELRAAVGWPAPILIDQEGGRVQRMRAPHWREYMPALDQMAAASDPIRAMWLRNRLIAQELYDVGIDVNCAPLADIAEPETHPVLRNRLYGSDVDTVARAARASAEGLMAGGVLPVLKHLPGYGRARVDPHLGLPRVTEGLGSLAAHDFVPFCELTDLPMGMTAHIVLEALSDEPVTLSAEGMSAVRDHIGFGNLVMTDDISMEALSGDVVSRSARAWAAGCDLVLHCNGEMAEMRAIAAVAPRLEGEAQARAARALEARHAPEPIDIPAALAEFEGLLSASRSL